MPPRKSNNVLIVVLAIAGSVVLGCGGMFFLGVIGSVAGNNASQTSPASAIRSTLPPLTAPSSVPSSRTPLFQPSPSWTMTTTTKPAPAAIGQQARDGDTVFVVTSLDQSKIAGDPSNPYMQVTAQGTFLNVHLAVRNAGSQPQTFFATNQKLKLSSSVYEANGSAALWTGSMNVSINPGNAIQVVVSFDVPGSTVLSGTIELHQSLISPGVEVTLS